MGARKKKGRKQKNRAYFMRFAPKVRRRREAKTDYQARVGLIRQDKNKYHTPKWRFIVRITNKDVVCQVARAKVIGDEIIASAYSHELKRYGLSTGLTNYSACYCTGLLLARRLLKKLGMEDYEGKDEPDGTHFLEEAEYQDEDGNDIDDVKEPFKCFLDVGLRRTTTGARVFAAMKGATDGGVNVPHRDGGKQFPGFAIENGEESFDAETCRKYIMGGHVGEYMTRMQGEDEAKYNKHFAKYIAAGIGPDDLEDLYSKVHAAIRANPEPQAKKKGEAQVSKYTHKKKNTLTQRRDHVLNKILNLRSKKAAQA